jgi:hypothetical protein
MTSGSARAYSQKQLNEFATIQDSQGKGRAYLAETAELAYNGRNEKGEWGLALGAQAQSLVIDIIGMNFIPLYKIIGPFIFFVSLLLMG